MESKRVEVRHQRPIGVEGASSGGTRGNRIERDGGGAGLDHEERQLMEGEKERRMSKLWLHFIQGEHWREVAIRTYLRILTLSTGSPKYLSNSKSMVPFFINTLGLREDQSLTQKMGSLYQIFWTWSSSR